MRVRINQRKPEHRATLYEGEALERLRAAGALAAATLDHIEEAVQPGVSADRLDQICHTFIADHGARPAPLGYRGFPKATCISIDDVVCHGVPGDQILEEGAILNIDVAVCLEGYHGDASRMFEAGVASNQARALAEAAYHAMMAGVSAVRPGATMGDLGHAVQQTADAAGATLVREFCGHGVGRAFHEPPTVLHHGKPGTGVVFEPGMVFTIEPMLNAGSRRIVIDRDGWTARTRDGALSAQWEHMVMVCEDGVEIMTGGAREHAGRAPFPWRDQPTRVGRP